VRQHGRLGTARGLGLGDHACWIYDDDEGRRGTVADFLVDGLRLRQRLLYVGGDSVERLHADLEALDGVGSLIEDGALQVVPLRGVGPAGGGIDAERRLEAYAAATDQAVAEGYTGLRVAVAAGGLVTGSDAWDAHTRWEGLVDRAILSRPMTALCLYDRREVPDRVLADIASVHPISHAPAGMVPFRVFSRPDALALEGEVDYFSADALGRLLAMTPRGDGEVVLDLSGLGFVDHHGVMALVEHARKSRPSHPLRFQKVPYQVERLCDLMGVSL
jgi:ABC-type transporter Mla MlaB component